MVLFTGRTDSRDYDKALASDLKFQEDWRRMFEVEVTESDHLCFNIYFFG